MKLTVVGVAAGAMMCLGVAGHGRPAYAEKEKKECGYCHVNSAGGGERNWRGKYYEQNHHSLVGLMPALKLAWTVDAPAEARRIGVGDLSGDKRPRVVVVGTTNEATVWDLGGEKPLKEAAVDLGQMAARFAVAQLSKSKPACIAVPGKVVYKSGDGYTSKPAPALAEITGTAAFAEEGEYVFSFDGINEPTTYGLDPAGAKLLVDGPTMVLPDQGAGVYRSVRARLSPDAAAALGVPEPAQKTGVFGLWDARSDGKLYVWAPWIEKDESALVIGDVAGILGAEGLKPLWKSPKLAGKILDAAACVDPKTGKQGGILILCAADQDPKARTFQFWALD